MGIRFLLLAIALLLILGIARHFFLRTRAGGARRRPPAKAVDIVRCAYCGVHLPKPEAIARDTRFYCSRRHLDAARKNLC